jgi:hypothetical protein
MPVLSERRGLAELSRQNQSKEGSESPSRSHCGAQGVSSAQRYERNEKNAPQVATSDERCDEPHRTDEVVLSATFRLRCFRCRVGEVEERFGEVGRKAFAEPFADDESLCEKSE